MPEKFALKNFEGPLDLLLLLVQKDEIEIVEIAIHLLTQQFLHHFQKEEVNRQADQMAILAQLLLLKSRKLAPKFQEETSLLDCEERYTLIDQLLEHCQFKEFVDALQEKESQSHAHFTRMVNPFEEKEKTAELGLADVTLTELKRLFTKLYENAKPRTHEQIIQGARWEVKEKIENTLTLLTQQKELPFAMLFEKSSCKEELIVTFLALLELIKQGKILVILDNNYELKFTRQ